MSHELWVILYEYFIFQKFFFSDFLKRYPSTFSLLLWGHIHINRILSSYSSECRSQKFKKFSKKNWFLSLNIALRNIRVDGSWIRDRNFTLSCFWDSVEWFNKLVNDEISFGFNSLDDFSFMARIGIELVKNEIVILAGKISGWAIADSVKSAKIPDIHEGMILVKFFIKWPAWFRVFVLKEQNSNWVSKAF